MKRKGAGAALVLGLVFGVALGPCTFAFMAPMLAVAFKVADGQPSGPAPCWFSSMAWATAWSSPWPAAAPAWVQKTLDWNTASPAGLRLRKACGILVILGGFYLLYTAR